jgi:ketosteroid isomerase-like protein
VIYLSGCVGVGGGDIGSPTGALGILYTFVEEMQVPSTGALVASVREWMASWGDEVATVRMDQALERFDPGVVGFGTAADIVHGIDALHAHQWASVWPSIRGFAFDVARLEVLASPDGCQAVAIAPWSSQGRAADGSWFDRPGRATVVLRRDGEGHPWRGVHTHFSLVPVSRNES